jgi:hypothetical protein
MMAFLGSVSYSPGQLAAMLASGAFYCLNVVGVLGHPRFLEWPVRPPLVARRGGAVLPPVARSARRGTAPDARVVASPRAREPVRRTGRVQGSPRRGWSLLDAALFRAGHACRRVGTRLSCRDAATAGRSRPRSFRVAGAHRAGRHRSGRGPKRSPGPCTGCHWWRSDVRSCSWLRSSQARFGCFSRGWAALVQPLFVAVERAHLGAVAFHRSCGACLVLPGRAALQASAPGRGAVGFEPVGGDEHLTICGPRHLARLPGRSWTIGGRAVGSGS